jgi:hypothetical protein
MITQKYQHRDFAGRARTHMTRNARYSAFARIATIVLGMLNRFNPLPQMVEGTFESCLELSHTSQSLTNTRESPVSLR